MANEKKNLNIKVDGLKDETENLRHKLNLLQIHPHISIHEGIP